MAVHRLTKVIQDLRNTGLSGEARVSDGQLLSQFIEHHDESAFAALVYRHGPMVWGVCRRVIAHHQDAEDAFQAVFLVLARKAQAIRPREMVANWLFGVAHRTALKAKSLAGKRQMRERQVTIMPEPEAPAPSGWEDLESVLDQELAHLPDNYRIAIVLCDLEGRKGKDVARQLKIPAGTLASRLRTGRVMLAKRLARHGLTVSGGMVATVLSQNASSACAPTALVSSTITAATVTAAGKTAAAGMVSANARTLMEGVMKAMYLTKLKAVLTVLLLVGMVAFGGGLLRDAAARQEGKALPERRTQANPRTEPPTRIAPDAGQGAVPDAAPTKGATRAEKGSARTVTYAVADLVVPIRGLDAPANGVENGGGRTREDWLIRKITQTVAPSSWEAAGGTGTIQYLPNGMALVVNNTARVQAQVKYLLETMRRLQDVQVVAETRIISLDGTTFAKLQGLLPQLKKDGHVVLNDAETFALARKTQDDARTTVTQAPKVTVFSGQSVSLRIDPSRTPSGNTKLDVTLNALVAANLCHVDVDVQAIVDKVEFKKAARLEEGMTLVQVRRVGDSYMMLLVTPRVILNLEAEVSSQGGESHQTVPAAVDKAPKGKTKK